MYEVYFKIEIKILEPYVNLFKVNLFLANVPILYPLNTGEFRWLISLYGVVIVSF